MIDRQSIINASDLARRGDLRVLNVLADRLVAGEEIVGTRERLPVGRPSLLDERVEALEREIEDCATDAGLNAVETRMRDVERRVDALEDRTGAERVNPSKWAAYSVTIGDDGQRRALVSMIDALERWANESPPTDNDMMTACRLALRFMVAHISTQNGPVIGPLVELDRVGDSKGAFHYLIELRDVRLVVEHETVKR